MFIFITIGKSFNKSHLARVSFMNLAEYTAIDSSTAFVIIIYQYQVHVKSTAWNIDNVGIWLCLPWLLWEWSQQITTEKFYNPPFMGCIRLQVPIYLQPWQYIHSFSRENCSFSFDVIGDLRLLTNLLNSGCYIDNYNFSNETETLFTGFYRLGTDQETGVDSSAMPYVQPAETENR